MRLEGEGIWDRFRVGWPGGETKRRSSEVREDICIVAVLLDIKLCFAASSWDRLSSWLWAVKSSNFNSICIK
jgi:hypothetical protein